MRVHTGTYVHPLDLDGASAADGRVHDNLSASPAKLGPGPLLDEKCSPPPRRRYVTYRAAGVGSPLSPLPAGAACCGRDKVQYSDVRKATDGALGIRIAGAEKEGSKMGQRETDEL